MSSLTLKSIPAPLLNLLRKRAAADRRSLRQEALYLLEQALLERPAIDAVPSWVEAERQADSWMRLAGQWDSDKSPAEEIAEIYRQRTAGRPISL